MPLFMVGGVNVSTIIDKKERNLLINSEILKKATETKKIFHLLNKREKITDDLLSTNPSEYNYIKKQHSIWINAARNEWKYDKKKGNVKIIESGNTKKYFCELCGTKLTDQIHYLINKENGSQLATGYQCAGIILSAGYSNLIKWLRKNPEGLSKLEFLQKKYPEIDDIIEQKAIVSGELKIVIPQRLYDKILESKKALFSESQRYISDNTHPYFEEIWTNLYKNYINSISEYEEFYRNNADKYNFLSNDVLTQLLRQQDCQEIIKLVRKNNGQVNALTASRIKSINFIRNFAKAFSVNNKDNNIEIVEYSLSKINLRIVLENRGYICSISTSHFIDNFWTLLQFGKPKENLIDFYKKYINEIQFYLRDDHTKENLVSLWTTAIDKAGFEAVDGIYDFLFKNEMQDKINGRYERNRDQLDGFIQEYAILYNSSLKQYKVIKQVEIYNISKRLIYNLNGDQYLNSELKKLNSYNKPGLRGYIFDAFELKKK